MASRAAQRTINEVYRTINGWPRISGGSRSADIRSAGKLARWMEMVQAPMLLALDAAMNGTAEECRVRTAELVGARSQANREVYGGATDGE